MEQPNVSERINADTGKTLALVAAVGALVAGGIYAVLNHTPRPSTFTTSLTFTTTNRLAVTHYVIIPATRGDWAAMTSRYPAHVTKTVLNFK